VRRRLAVAALVLVLASSCGDELAQPEVVANLRVLGMRAEPPMAPPGTEVALDALIVTPEEDVAVERVWFACVATPGASASDCVGGATSVPPCAAEPEARVCLLGGGEGARYTLPRAALDGRAAGDDGQVHIGLLAAETAGGGVAGCLEAFIERGAVPEPCRIAVKRVEVLADGSTRRNANPGIAGLEVDGARLRLSLAEGAAEPTDEGPEKLFFSWFVTAGELDAFRTDLDGGDAGLDNLWTPATQRGRVVVVVRDGRGGESWVVARR
jgi:hypothetical protein